MSQKKPAAHRLQNTLNELDSALEQWDSITNKPEREQASVESSLQQKAKTLFKELRNQIAEFDTIKSDALKDNNN